MGLILKLNNAMVEQSLARSTMQCYRFWNRKFYGFIKMPASQWKGADVKSFMLWLYDEKYSPVSRKSGIDFGNLFVNLDSCESLKSIPLGSLASRPCRSFLGGTFAGRVKRLLPAKMKTIPLTQGFSAIVDDDDFDRVSKYKWHAVRLGSRKTPYAKRVDYSLGRRNGKQVFMHHFILGIASLIDHKNGNTLDYQKDNLRPCSSQQNGFNHTVISKQNGKPTRFKGICWHRRIKKWQASIGFNWRKIHIGYFDSEVSAAEAYNKKAVELFGEFAAINNLTHPDAANGVSPLDCISSPTVSVLPLQLAQIQNP